MDSVWILLKQLLEMLFYMAVGFTLCRCKIISQAESKAISNLLLYAVIPSVIFCSYLELPRSQLPEVLLSLALGALVLLLAIFMSKLLFRGHPEEEFGAAFSNAGFVGIPLICGTLGQDSVMYISGMVALLNILQWTYGQRLLANSRASSSVWRILRNPLIGAYLFGFLLFLLQIQLPAPVLECLDTLGDCNAPLAMIVLGISLGNANIRTLFFQPRAWFVCIVRLFLIPAVTILILWPLPAAYRMMKLAIVIAASAPIGANLVIYAQKNRANESYSATLVCLSTLLCVVTLPVCVAFAERIW